jgi:hypothetical protein
MTINRNRQGAYVITDLVNGELFTQMYMGYTKKEAISLFRKAKREKRGY